MRKFHDAGVFAFLILVAFCLVALSALPSCNSLMKTTTVTYPDGRIETVKELDLQQISVLVSTYGDDVQPLIDKFKDLWEYLHDAEKPTDESAVPEWVRQLQLAAANAQEIRASIDALLAAIRPSSPTGRLAAKAAVSDSWSAVAKLHYEYGRLEKLGIGIDR